MSTRDAVPQHYCLILPEALHAELGRALYRQGHDRMVLDYARVLDINGFRIGREQGK